MDLIIQVRLHEEQFPYIPTSTIAETLKRLVKHHKVLVRGKYPASTRVAEERQV
jgi:hypothetical protein